MGHETDQSGHELDALLVKRATEPLTGDESRRLRELLGDGEPDTRGYDRAAAAIFLAATRSDDSLPDRIRERLIATADSYLSASRRSR